MAKILRQSAERLPAKMSLNSSLNLADRCPNRGIFGGCNKDGCMHQLTGECVWAQYQMIVKTTTGTGGGTDEVSQ